MLAKVLHDANSYTLFSSNLMRFLYPCKNHVVYLIISFKSKQLMQAAKTLSRPLRCGLFQNGWDFTGLGWNSCKY